MNFKEAVGYVLDSFSDPAAFPPMLLMGDQGIGKSAVARAACNTLLSRGHKCRVVDLRLAHCDAGDIKGMPVAGNGHVFYGKGDWFPIHVQDRQKLKDTLEALGRKYVENSDDDEYVILFLDELNRAPRDVQQATFQLIYDRELDGVRLSERCVVMSAINDNSDLYQTTRMDPALLDRFFMVKFMPSPEEFLGHLKDLVSAGRAHQAVMAFLRAHPNYIDPTRAAISKSTDENTKTYSRRSWVRLAVMLQKRETLHASPASSWGEFLGRFASCQVGFEAGLKFARYVESSYETLSAAAVLKIYDESMSHRIRNGRVDELAALVDDVTDILAKEGANALRAPSGIPVNLFRLMVDLPDEITKKLSMSLNAKLGARFPEYLKRKDLGTFDREGNQFSSPMERYASLHLVARK
jgi:hypothetical protein